MASVLNRTRIGRRALLIAGSISATLGRGKRAVAARPKSVSFAFFGDAAEEKVYTKLIDAFHAVNAEIEIKPVYTPDSTQYTTKLSSAFAGGEPPDVLLISYRRFAQYAARGALAQLDDFLDTSETLKRADFYGPPMDAFKLGDGRLFGIPQNASSLVVYYNADHFNNAGIPLPYSGWTLDEFTAAASKLTIDTNGDGLPEQHGLAVEPSISRYAAFIWGAGGEVVDNVDHATTLTIETPEAVEAIRWFIALGQTGLKVTPTEAEVLSEDDITRFTAGRASMLIHSRRVVPTLRQAKGLNWDVAPLPLGKQPANVLHSDAMAMSSNAPDKAAAWAFIEFAMGPAGQMILAETGRTVPSLKSVAESDAFLKGTFAGDKLGINALAMPPAHSRVYLDNIDVLRRLPSVSTWPEVENGFETPFKRAFYVEIDLADALDMATYQSKQALERAREESGN
jgi:multiple sugar transport system substrate-binding protein